MRRIRRGGERSVGSSSAWLWPGFRRRRRRSRGTPYTSPARRSATSTRSSSRSRTSGRDLIRVRVDMVLTFKRLNDKITMELRYGTIETPEGAVLRLDTRTLASEQEIRASGDVINDQMTLTLEGSGQSQKMTIPWGPEVRGPYAVEQSLSREPMKVGETRTLKMFIPDLNKVCDITLTAKAMEDIQLGGGREAIADADRAEDGPRGQAPARVRHGLLGRCRRAGAQERQRRHGGDGHLPDDQGGGHRRWHGAGKLDQIVTSIIKVTHKITKPETRRNITYGSSSRTTTCRAADPERPPPDAHGRDGSDDRDLAGQDRRARRRHRRARPGRFRVPPAQHPGDQRGRQGHRARRSRRRRRVTDPWQRSRIEQWVVPEREGQELQDGLRPRQRGGAEPHRRLHRARRPDRRHVPRPSGSRRGW